jgi:uncharacterized protein (DUF3820 family)
MVETPAKHGADIVPIGKYKGQPVEVLQGDPQYVEWLMGQDWVRTKYPQLFTLIVNNFGEPTETPEHNRFQAMFLDEAFACKVYDGAYPDRRINWAKKDRNDEVLGPIRKEHEAIKKERDEKLKELKQAQEEDLPELQIVRDAFRETERKLEEARKAREQFRGGQAIYDCLYNYTSCDRHNSFCHKPHCIPIREAYRDARKAADTAREHYNHVRDAWTARNEFPAKIEQLAAKMKELAIQHNEELDKPLELCSLTTRFEVKGADVDISPPNEAYTVRIEIKPSMGDDFPAVMRQMKANHCNVLYLDAYTGAGATLEQVTKMFAASGMRVLLHKDFAATAQVC